MVKLPSIGTIFPYVLSPSTILTLISPVGLVSKPLLQNLKELGSIHSNWNTEKLCSHTEWQYDGVRHISTLLEKQEHTLTRSQWAGHLVDMRDMSIQRVASAAAGLRV